LYRNGRGDERPVRREERESVDQEAEACDCGRVQQGLQRGCRQRQRRQLRRPEEGQKRAGGEEGVEQVRGGEAERRGIGPGSDDDQFKEGQE